MKHKLKSKGREARKLRRSLARFDASRFENVGIAHVPTFRDFLTSHLKNK